MKVRVIFTVEVDDTEREAIGGINGKANREEVRAFFRANGASNGETLLGDLVGELDD